MRKLSFLLKVFLFVMGTMLASSAYSCAVCGFGADDNAREAFIITTGIMTFVPLIFIGSVVFYIRRRMLKMAEEEAAES